MVRTGILHIGLWVAVFVIFVFALFFIYIVFMSGGSNSASGFENFLRSVGFDLSDKDPNDYTSVPLPSSGSNGYVPDGGAGSSGSPAGSFGSEVNLAFCTFDVSHVVSGETPCRCGISAICDSENMVCDATFNGGQGECL